MASLLSSRPAHTKSSQRGLTLIEIVIVMGIISIVGAFTLVVSLDSFRGFTYRSDRDLLIAALDHARSQAVGNNCMDGGLITCTGGVAHGVHINTDAAGYITGYVVFQGTTYVAGDAVNATIVPSGTVRLDLSDVIDISQVVFAQLSAQVPVPGTIVLADRTGHVSTTTIGDEGQIAWTN